MREVETVVIGAGIAGLSLAARIASRMEVVVLEAESAPGYHASGRSVAFAHFGLGERIIRTLTALSLPELRRDPPADTPRTAQTHKALHIASKQQLADLDALEAVHRGFGCDCERISGDDARALVPILKSGPDHCHSAIIDHGAIKLDTDAMLQSHLRELRAAGGELLTHAQVSAIRRDGDAWEIESSVGAFRATYLVNAAGAWVDQIAALAGVKPIGIEPRRRTVISIDPAQDADISGWPFVKTVGEGFYMLPEGSAWLLASPMDESPSAPCDAAPEELDIARIAHRLEQATTIALRRIEHSWAGLRSFAPGELPVIGFAADAPGFFWCAGQGGAGFQTSPALSRVAEALLLGSDWPDRFLQAGIEPECFSPARFGA